MQHGAHPEGASPGPTLLVALHHGHHNKVFASPGKDCPDASYRNMVLDALGLADHISTGFAWVACHLGPHPATGEVGWRNEDAYLASNLAVLDIDGDLTLDAFWAIPFVQKHCLFTATSCSHNPAGQHRFRAVFQFSPTAQEVGLHRHIVLALESYLGFSPKDTAGRKPERLWYGNDRAEIRFGDGEILPAELVFDAQDDWAGEQRQERDRKAENKPVTDLDIKQAIWLLASGSGLRQSGEGEYESYWTKVCAGAACSGSEAVWDAFLTWHRGGYHDWSDNSPRAVEKKRWGFRKSGIGGLFGLAADQFGRHWRDILPPELRHPRVVEPPASLIRSAAPITAETENQFREPTKLVAAAPHPEAGAGPTVLVSASTPDSLSMGDMRRFAASEHGSGTEKDSMQVLIDRIYMLTLYSLHKSDSGLSQIDDEDDAQALIDFYTNQLYGYQLFARNPALLDRRMLRRLRHQCGSRPRSLRNLQLAKLLEANAPSGKILIPGLMEAGKTYLLYGTPGTGKTTFALMLARAVTAAPGHRQFLDFEEVPASAWRNRRVLIVASDGGDTAKGTLTNYSRWHQMLGAEWQQHYLDVLAGSEESAAPAWTMDLPCMRLLMETLDGAIQEGLPFDLVIFDSLKAICPPGLLVGDQVVTDYLETIRAICSVRGAAQLYLHHQARDSDRPQGVAGLTEMTDGNFHIRLDENKLHHFTVQKSRAEWDCHRSIPFTIANGELTAGMGAAAHRQVDVPTFLLRVIQAHIEEHRQRTAIFPSTSDARVYRGLKPTEVWDYMQEKGLRHPEINSLKTAQRKCDALLENGTLQWTEGSRKIRGLIPAGLDPRTLHSDQGELDAFSDLPGADDEP